MTGLTLLTASLTTSAAEWQWSVPQGSGRAFLWIPPNCTRVRAVLVGQHNMSEEGIFEHPTMRAELAKLGIAEVWVAPPSDGPFDFHQGAGERFDAMMTALAAESGYSELAIAPVIPIGHSACATYPWNFAAWNPGRTLAILSVHGDAPRTNMTGYGRANMDWGDRTIDGVPGLMVMAEYEWLEGRLTPAIAFREKQPLAPVAMLAEPGRGHFDVSDDLIAFLVMFIRKAVEYRLPAESEVGRVSDPPLPGETRKGGSQTRPTPELRPIDPRKGWLVERWHLNQRRKIPPAPAANYTGDPKEAFWCFDEEMARATHTYRAAQIGRLPQLLGFIQDGKIVPQTNTHDQVSLRFDPLDDGLSFRLAATFLETVDGGSSNTTRWSGLPPGARIGHASGGGPIKLSRITGPVVQTGADTFRVRLNRTASTTDRRLNDVWLLAEHPGDEKFKSAVQQALLLLPVHNTGADQRITFPEISEQKAGTKSLKLTATSSADVPVSYYVREGPAEIEGDTLRFTAIPPRTKFPLKVTVVAWQFGRGTSPAVKAAASVERTFLILP